jgi:outer membrane murein-binding lipoprotein Lpp
MRVYGKSSEDKLTSFKGDPIMRKLYGLCLFLAVALLVTSCGNETADKVADIHSDAEELESRVDDLKSRLAELQDEVDRFDDTNWRDVVPEIQTRVFELQSEGEMLSSRAVTLLSKVEKLHSAVDDSDHGDY